MQSADLTLRLPPSMRMPVPELAVESVLHREELLSWHVDSESETVRFLAVRRRSRGIQEVVTDLEFVHRYDISRVDDDTFYGYVEMDLRESDAMLLGAFDVSGLVVVPPVVYTGRETVHATVLGNPTRSRRCSRRSPTTSASRSSG